MKDQLTPPAENSHIISLSIIIGHINSLSAKLVTATMRSRRELDRLDAHGSTSRSKSMINQHKT